MPALTGTEKIAAGEKEDAERIAMELIGALRAAQDKARDKEDRSIPRGKRRLVSGLRECARGLRANKVRMIFMAANLDGYEALDEKVLEIFRLCEDRDVVLFRFLSKRRLGKALGKNVKMSVVAIENFEGAHDLHKKLRKAVGTF